MPSVTELLPGNGSKPWKLELRSSTPFITATVCAAVFTDIFLYAVIVPVIPFSLVQRIGVDPADTQQWVSILLSVYSAALLVAAPIFGWLSDRIRSRRGPLLGGMIVLGGATVMLCLAKSLAVMILGRVLQGASAGVVWVVGLALLADTVGPKNAGTAMGFVATGYSLAALVGPLLGGIVYDKAGYYSVFAMCFGMIAFDIALRLLLVEKRVAAKWLEETDSSPHLVPEQSQDVEKHTASVDTPSIRETKDEGNNLARNISITQSIRSKKLPPMIILLKSRRMQATFCGSTIGAVILITFDVTLPLFVKETFDWSSLGAGLIFLALMIATFVQPLFGWCVDKYGARWIATAGFATCTIPFICLRFVTENSIRHKVLLCALLFLIGLGTALVLAAVMAEFTYICAEKERKSPGSMGSSGAYAQSYSLFNVSWALGSLIGSYWGGGVKEIAGWATMGWSIALLCAVTCVPTALYCGGSLFGTSKDSTDD